MNVAVMDTLEASRGLEAAGVEHGQTEAMVKMVAAATAASREDLATKADFAEIKAEFAELKTEFAELKTEFATAVNRIILGQIAAAGVLFAAIALLFAALKFF